LGAPRGALKLGEWGPTGGQQGATKLDNWGPVGSKWGVSGGPTGGRNPGKIEPTRVQVESKG